MFIALEVSYEVLVKLVPIETRIRLRSRAREVTGALRIALVKQYITREDVAAVEGPLDRLRGMLWRLTH